MLALLGEILDIGALHLGGPQALQRHHHTISRSRRRRICSGPCGVVGIGDGREQPGQFLIAEVLEILGGLAHARPFHAGGGIIVAQAGVARGLVEAAHDGQLPADGDGGVLGLDQRRTVAFDVHHRDGGRIEALLGAPGHPRFDLVAVVGDGVHRGIATGHVDAQEVGEGGVQLGRRPRRPVIISAFIGILSCGKSPQVRPMNTLRGRSVKGARQSIK